ncbi:MAG TPA: hypothetical protein VGJ70_12720 [Solirubrobacteraceae bacterium]
MLPANSYTIRPAVESDAEALRGLAILDSQLPLSGRILVAQDNDVTVAALSLDENREIADPFEPTDVALLLLRARAGAVRAYERGPSLRERLLDRLRRRGRYAGGAAVTA